MVPLDPLQLSGELLTEKKKIKNLEVSALT